MLVYFLAYAFRQKSPDVICILMIKSEMITWITEMEDGHARIQLFEHEVLTGWILPPHRVADTTKTAEWAGRWFYLHELPRPTISFRAEHPETGLAADLQFKLWGRSANIQTNVGGQLLLRRPKFWGVEYHLWDGKEQLFHLDMHDCRLTLAGKDRLKSVREQLYAILVIYSLVTFGFRTSHA